MQTMPFSSTCQNSTLGLGETVVFARSVVVGTALVTVEDLVVVFSLSVVVDTALVVVEDWVVVIIAVVAFVLVVFVALLDSCANPKPKSAAVTAESHIEISSKK